MKTALVHDYLVQYGGAERVLEEAHALFPEAPVYTSIYDPVLMPDPYREWDIRTTWLQRLPGASKRFRQLMPLYPWAWESLDLTGYDVVISFSSGLCLGVMTPPETLSICYCHTPARFLWNYHEYVRREGMGRFRQRAVSLVLPWLRTWDRAAADRVDYFIANSSTVRKRIAKYYRRDSTVIHPPVDVGRFAPASGHDDYYLVLSRLIPYKRLDLAIEAANRLKVRLVVAGSGRDEARLKGMAGPTVEFVGRVNDEQMKELYARCRAFIFPGEEDFGITPLEAMASGRPVIAYRRGGALDTVVEGVTGAFFDEQTPEALAEVMRAFDADAYDPAVLREHASRFDSAVFRGRLQAFVEQCRAGRHPRV